MEKETLISTKQLNNFGLVKKSVQLGNGFYSIAAVAPNLSSNNKTLIQIRKLK